MPCKKQAIGWRVAVYWREDSTLYEGEIIAFDNITLRHHIRYDSGDHEHVLLDAVKVYLHPYCQSKQVMHLQGRFLCVAITSCIL